MTRRREENQRQGGGIKSKAAQLYTPWKNVNLILIWFFTVIWWKKFVNFFFFLKYHYGGNFFFYEEKKTQTVIKTCGYIFLSRTLPCRSVGLSVGRSVGHIFEFRAVFVLLLLPNRPRLDCRVAGLVFRSSWVICLIPLTKNTERYAFEKFTQFCLPFTFHSLICASIN